MNSMILLVALLVAVAVVLIVVKAGLGRRNEAWPFYAKKPLTHIEQILYFRLVNALPECIVLAQVQVSRILGVKKGYNFAAWNNKINRLSLDFVVCRKDSSVIAAIELDDSTHNRPSRREADQRKERALKAAGVPLIRWSVKALPEVAAIPGAIASATSNAGTP